MSLSESTAGTIEAGSVEGDAVREAGYVPRALAPPPPSAPSEFLSAQWMANQRFPAPARGFHDVLAPPPPSAPAEFLDSQWTNETAPDEDAGTIDVSLFDDAFPRTAQGTEDLEQFQGEDSDNEELHVSEEGGRPAAESIAPPRIRGFPLLAGERVSSVLLPNGGLSDKIPPSGQALILTNHRLIAFRGVEGYRDTHVARTAGISQCSVRTGQRNWSAVLQGLMIMVGGAFLYLVVGYWLAGQISGPNVPVLNIDVAPFISLLIVLAGLLVLLQNYFTRPAGAVIFHGEGVEIAFPFRSSLDVTQVYDFVDLAQSGPGTIAQNPEDSGPTGA